MLVVRLKAPYRNCNAGEIAGFPDAEARRLIERGAAEPHGTATVQQPTPAVQAPAPPVQSRDPQPQHRDPRQGNRR